MLSVVNEETAVADGRSMLDEICREGAQQMLAAALEAEVDAYVAELSANAMTTVIGSSHATAMPGRAGPQRWPVRSRSPRRGSTTAGSTPRRGRRQVQELARPAVVRRSPKVTEVLPLLYLHGLSTGDFVPALEGFFGSAAGLSASVITRLTTAWQDDHRAFMARELADRDYVYVWADGVHFNVRLEEERLCCLVIVGVRLDGTKELVAIADGYRESKDSWAALLRDLRHRGMRAPVLAVGDGALGFWAALRDVFPETKEQRCWVHKVGERPRRAAEVDPAAREEDARPRSATPRTATTPVTAAKAFDAEFRAKWPKAADKIRDDLDQLLCFFDFPAEHWVHLKTTNAIESTFATVRLRTKVTKGPGSRAAGLAMAFKLLEAAEDRWRYDQRRRSSSRSCAPARSSERGCWSRAQLQEEEVAA